MKKSYIKLNMKVFELTSNRPLLAGSGTSEFSIGGLSGFSGNSGYDDEGYDPE